VAIVKDKDVYVMSDYWRIVMNFDFTTYEESITILRKCNRNGGIRQTQAHVGELQNGEMALNSLERK
jgi:hypothetical protein